MHLAVLDRGRVVYVHKVEGAKTAGLPTQAGVRLYAHGSAVGKVLLAELPSSGLAEVVAQEGLPALTRRTITGEAALLAATDEVRRRGYATDREETLRGISCVAVPIRAPGGEVVAAMSVCAGSQRLERNWTSYVREAEATARAASAQLRSRGANGACAAAVAPL
jgi:DNA-binding IclR family transcriptional regulator